MMKRGRLFTVGVCLTAMLLPFGSGVAQGEQRLTKKYAEKVARVQRQRAARITQADREATAARLREQRQKVEAARKAMKLSGATSFKTEMPPDVTPPGPSAVPMVPDYFTTPNWAFSPPLKKFVNRLAGLGPAGMNDLNNYIPVAVPDTVTYPGADYYEIELREYEHRFHSELNPTVLRGYVQTNKGTNPDVQNPTLADNVVEPAPIMYLGPVIVAKRDRPVRLKFTNKLPGGEAGKLNIPVDTTIMGAGMGPLDANGNPCDNTVENAQCASYTDTRAAIHLHGGRTPWISDGTPFQWITPAEEATPYKEGVSLFNVPDMPEPGPGATTYYYSNQQSARLMFYHDHAWGITRLNVLVGQAAGYLITDDHEQALVGDGPGKIPAEQIPLVIQDRTFVDADTVRDTDPTWNWGSGTPDANGIRPPVTGDLWIPHVYMPAQNPYDISGTATYGRWVYGPWFWPPTNNILHPPVPNPYYDPNCDSLDPAVFATCTTPGQPPMIPGTPNVSVGMETFFDTQTVNGVAFPTTTVKPKAYRFRILNASNDRFVNLSLYEADPTQVSSDGRENTEIKMIDAAPGKWDANKYPLWPADGREGGVPDPTTSGPPMIQIGTEGGFLPKPVVIPAQPIGYFTDPTVFNVGNVKDKAVLLGPAERADVVIDFSKYKGKTLILYNDAPTAFPALDVRTDLYAGAPDYSDTGGYGRLNPATGEVEGPQIGFGPNTRTIMQIKVEDDTPAPEYDVNALVSAFLPDSSTGRKGVFETAQEPIIVGQAAYNGVYTGKTFPNRWPYWGVSRIQDTTLSFMTAAGNLVANIPMEPKGIHDEMGASFDPEYGRMSGNLGTELPNTDVRNQNFVLYDFTDPATEIVYEAITPVLGDGTQIWKITHNGVDTHPIHFHIFDVQLINRVGWDGGIRLPDPNEMGWKDTIRISPLEDTIVAMRPKPPDLPFNIPDSVRPLNPGIPLGSTMGFTNLDPLTGEAITPPVTNEMVNFAWEYVWHCHILSHEEMDMMRPIILNVESAKPGAPTLSAVQAGGNTTLTWTDPTPVDYVTQAGFGDKSSEIGFRIERSVGAFNDWQPIAKALANQTGFVDVGTESSQYYGYRVVAYNEAGETASNVADVNIEVLVPPLAGRTPASLAFGNQLLGTTSAAQTITVFNTGVGPLLVRNIRFEGAAAGDFGQTNTCAEPVQPASNCVISVRFTPTAMGARGASLVVATNDPANPFLGSDLTGTGVAPVATVVPGAVAFAGQLVNTASAGQIVRLTNTGTAPMAFAGVTITGPNAAEFTQTNACPATIAVNGTCNITVRFTPAAMGARSATLTINSNAIAAPTVVPLTGTGIAPVLEVTPTSVALAAPYMMVSAAQPVTIRNAGTAPMRINAVSLQGTSAEQFAQSNDCGPFPATLAPGSSCTALVQFAPTLLKNSVASLFVNVAAPASSAIVSVTGTLIVPTYAFAPTSVYFASTPVGTSAEARSVTITNTSVAPLTIVSFTIAGTNASQFSQTNDCGGGLAPGAACTVNVVFSPTSVGFKSGSLRLNAAAPAASTSITLYGTGQ